MSGGDEDVELIKSLSETGVPLVQEAPSKGKTGLRITRTWFTTQLKNMGYNTQAQSISATFLLKDVRPVIESRYPRLPRSFTEVYAFFLLGDASEPYHAQVFPSEFSEFIRSQYEKLGSDQADNAYTIVKAKGTEYGDGLPIAQAADSGLELYHLKDKTDVYSKGKRIETDNPFYRQRMIPYLDRSRSRSRPNQWKKRRSRSPTVPPKVEVEAEVQKLKDKTPALTIEMLQKRLKDIGEEYTTGLRRDDLITILAKYQVRQKQQTTAQIQTERLKAVGDLYPLEPPVPLGDELMPRSVKEGSRATARKASFKLLYKGYKSLLNVLFKIASENSAMAKPWWTPEDDPARMIAEAYAQLLDRTDKALTGLIWDRLSYSFIYGGKFDTAKAAAAATTAGTTAGVAATALTWLGLPLAAVPAAVGAGAVAGATTGAESLTFPYYRVMQPQSVYTISLRRAKNGSVYASPCPDHYSITRKVEESMAKGFFSGLTGGIAGVATAGAGGAGLAGKALGGAAGAAAAYSARNKFELVNFDDKGEWDALPNDKTRMCVKTMDKEFQDRGYTTADKPNAAWLNWMGPWQQAERKLKKFNEENDKASKTFDWVLYLKQFIMLKLDVYIKWIAGLSDASNLEKESEIPQADDSWNPVMKEAFAVFKKVGKIGLIAGWKIVQWALKSPAFQLVLETTLNSVKLNLCEQFGTRTLRTDPKDPASMQEWIDHARVQGGEYSPLREAGGAWVTLSPAEQLRIERRDAAKRQAALMFGISGLDAIMKMLPASLSENFAKYAEAAQLAVQIEAIASMVPGGPTLLVSLGGAAALSDVVKQSFHTAAIDAVKEFRHLATLAGNVLRTYQMFSNAFDCSTTQLTTLNGGALGAVGPRHDQDQNVAYEIIVENMPFYAVKLIETWHEKQHPPYARLSGITDEEAWNMHITNFLQTELVENHRDTTPKMTAANMMAKAAHVLASQKADGKEFDIILGYKDDDGQFIKIARQRMQNTGVLSRAWDWLQSGVATLLNKEALRWLSGALLYILTTHAPDLLALIGGAVGTTFGGPAAGYATGAAASALVVRMANMAGDYLDLPDISSGALGAAAAAGGYTAADYLWDGGDLISGATYTLSAVLSKSELRDATFRLEIEKYKKLFALDTPIPVLDYEAPGDPSNTRAHLQALNTRLIHLNAASILVTEEGGQHFNLKAAAEFFGNLSTHMYDGFTPGNVRYTDKTAANGTTVEDAKNGTQNPWKGDPAPEGAEVWNGSAWVNPWDVDPSQLQGTQKQFLMAMLKKYVRLQADDGTVSVWVAGRELRIGNIDYLQLTPAGASGVGGSIKVRKENDPKYIIL